MYRRNRYYDPTSGRFTQEDPIGLAGGLSVYGYANGDPVSYRDPFGLMVDTVIADAASRQAVAECVANSKQCADEVHDLATDTTVWLIQTSPYALNDQFTDRSTPGLTTIKTSADGTITGGVITLDPTEVNGVIADEGIPLTLGIVLGHEMGHAISQLVGQRYYGDRGVCGRPEHCAIMMENIIRSQWKAFDAGQRLDP